LGVQKWQPVATVFAISQGSRFSGSFYAVWGFRRWKAIQGPDWGGLSGKLAGKRPDLGRCGMFPDRGDQRACPEDTDHMLEIIGEHVKRHFVANVLQSLHQEVGGTILD
jgi:hypothetical protein